MADLTEDDGAPALESERQRAADEREKARTELALHKQDTHALTA
jgi:hypothetical protein